MDVEATQLDFAQMALRIGLATLLGAALGFDRERTGHAAGIRTNGIIALSSAVITVSALLLFDQLRALNAQPDPLRAIQGLAQAIGFIAAGLIFVKGNAVHNITTAANVWLAAAIGIACGAGQYALVALATGFGLLLLTVVRFLKPLLPGVERDRD